MKKSVWELYRLSSMAFSNADFDGAIKHGFQAADAAKQQGIEFIELSALMQVASAAVNNGQAQYAIQAATRLMQRAAETNDNHTRLQAGALLCEAMSLVDLRGKWNDIQKLMLEGIELAEQLGATTDVVTQMGRLGLYEAKMGDPEGGEIRLLQAISMVNPMLGDITYFYGELYGCLAEVLLIAGKLDEAENTIKRAILYTLQHGNANFTAEAEIRLARIEIAQNKYETAKARLTNWHQLSETHNWRDELQQTAYLLARLWLLEDMPIIALNLVTQSLEIAREVDMYEAEVQCLLLQGACYLLNKQEDKALETYQTARDLSEQRRYGDHLAEAAQYIKSILDKREGS